MRCRLRLRWIRTVWVPLLAYFSAVGGAHAAAPRVQSAVEGGVEGGSLDVGGVLGARLRFPSELQIGVVAGGSRIHEGYISGRLISSGSAFRGQAWLLSVMGRTERVIVTFGTKWGAGYLRATEETPAGKEAVRLLPELSATAHLRLTRRWMLRAGPVFTFDWELAPTVAPASMATLIHLGSSTRLSDRLALVFDLRTGGSYGFNGNNEKYLTQGAMTLVFSLGKEQSPWLFF